MTTLASVLLAVFGGADTACAESGRRYDDGAVVLQVVENRRRSGWARYDGTRLDALYKRWQHAHGCTGQRGPLTLRHLRLGLTWALGRPLPVSSWARRAVFYCGSYDRPGTCSGRGDVERVGTVLHRFYALRRAKVLTVWGCRRWMGARLR